MNTLYGKKNENTDIQQMVEICTVSEEDAAKVIQEFEELLRTRKLKQYA